MPEFWEVLPSPIALMSWQQNFRKKRCEAGYQTVPGEANPPFGSKLTAEASAQTPARLPVLWRASGGLFKWN